MSVRDTGTGNATAADQADAAVGTDTADAAGVPLSGCAALVTGASSGIGAATALALARQGAALTLVARRTERLEELATAIGDQGGSCVALTADLRDPAQAQASVDAAIKAFGRLDILVNNAGATKRGDFFDLTEDDWDDGYALKFRGYVRMTRAAWPQLKANGGSVINIVGIGARTGSEEFTIGGSVNAALLYFTKAMAQRGIRDGVRVNAINPGHIETERLVRNFARTAERDGIPLDAARAQILAGCGTTRFGRPEEVAHACAFLASNKAEFFQASLIDLDGGETRGL
jgi:NAD(P)-dependent dehydrogenase (short-subunit alcohol dehydrogenase family)